MKMHKHFGLVLTACLVLSLLFTPAFLLPAQAANTVTVQGKVMSGTTGSLLLLDTPQGKMEIKIDNATDTTAGKILLPDQDVYKRQVQRTSVPTNHRCISLSSFP